MNVQKRINRELNFKCKSIHYDFDLPYRLVIGKYEEMPTEFNLINENTLKIEITIIVSDKYPFQPPTIILSPDTVKNFSLINYNKRKYSLSSNYLSWVGNLLKNNNTNGIYIAWLFTIIRFPKMYKLWRKIPKEKDCLCCESMTCPNLWSPAFTLYDLGAEYIMRKRFYFYTTKIMQKKLYSILHLLFYNDKWQLNDDLILHILRFCHNMSYDVDKIILKILNTGKSHGDTP